MTEASTNRAGQNLSQAAALVAAVTMASATASSSIASAQDLASIRAGQDLFITSRPQRPAGPESVEPGAVKAVDTPPAVLPGK